jgi:hypothetical protein
MFVQSFRRGPVQKLDISDKLLWVEEVRVGRGTGSLEHLKIQTRLIDERFT